MNQHLRLARVRLQGRLLRRRHALHAVLHLRREEIAAALAGVAALAWSPGKRGSPSHMEPPCAYDGCALIASLKALRPLNTLIGALRAL